MSTNHYVDNKKLYAEMIKYINSVNEAKSKNLPKDQWPVINSYIGSVILKIAIGLSNRPNFIGYTFKDEMIGDGVENCLMYLHNFNPDKSKNPFAYITQIMFFAFVRRIQKEQKQQYIKQKSIMNSDILSINEHDNKPTTLNKTQMDFVDSDKYQTFIDKFEKTNKIKKKPKKGIEKFLEIEKDE